MTDLSDKRILITGAASGIGRASSLLAASQGAAVMVVDYDESVADTAASIDAAGGTAIAVRADISDETAVESFIAQAIEKLGGLDAIYANAGVIGAYKPFLQMQAADWDRALSINLVGTFNCIKAAAAHFVTQKQGSIVCTASVAGIRANAGPVDYSASKAGVISMVQTIAYELYGTGVRINAVCPGLIETGMTKPVFRRRTRQRPRIPDWPDQSVSTLWQCRRDCRDGLLPDERCGILCQWSGHPR